MKTLITLVLAFVLYSASCLATTRSNDYEKALSLYDEGKYSEAEIIVKNSLQVSPEYLPARLLLGKTLLQQGKVHAAEKELSVSLDMGADGQIAVFPLVRVKLLLDKPEEAIALLARYAPLNTEPDYYLLMGNAYTAQANYTLAEQAYQTGLSAHGNLVTLLTAKASLHKAQGMPEKAQSTVKQALIQSPNHIPALLLQAELSKAEARYGHATAQYQRILEREPNNHNALFGLASVLLVQDKIAQALVLSTQLRKAVPDNPYAKLLHSSLLTLQGDVEEGKEVLRSLLKQLSNLPDDKRMSKEALLLAGVVDFMNQHFEQARTKLQRYITQFGENPLARRNLAAIALRDGDFAQAEMHIQHALGNQSDEVELLLLASAIFKQTKKPRDYLQFAEGLFGKHASVPLVRDTYLHALLSAGELGKAEALLSNGQTASSLPNQLLFGYLLLQQGKLEKATEVTQSLLQRAPSKVEVLQLAGELSLKLGQKDDAKKFFNHALQLDERFKPALLALAGMHLQQGERNKTESYYRQILDAFPRDVDVLQLYADLAVSTNQYLLAIKLLESLPAPQNATRENAMALLSLYIATEQFEQAEKTAALLEDIAPFNQDFLLARSQLEAKIGKPETAKKTLRLLFGLIYDQPDELEKLALLQLELNDTEACSTTLERLSTLRQAPSPYLNAKLNLALGDYASVNKAIENALENTPSEAWQTLNAENLLAQNKVDAALPVVKALFNHYPKRAHLQLLAQLYATTQQTDSLILLLESWLADNKNDTWAVAQLSALFEKQSNIAAARQVLEAYPNLNAQPLFLNNLATLYQADDLTKAAELANKAYKLAPDFAPINDTLGWILVQQGNPEQGLDLLRQALAKNSTNPTYHYHLAIALAKLNRMDSAKTSATTALSLNQTHSLAEEAKAILRH
ncbi:PEP-CTERM system TPR-repeat protein PrsT [Alteromonas sediminis]|uniref:PEP-CTERM system TPR-repeat protein PrsT n=1 Tax=Alteromonas sediminis TaxID=2259342 RepID=A0A3N5Y069_9ALTE|nr:XrtA/PEP-CTERM system TPR-repeat protein PrsT [Alteromonas sediminis]RPJ66420.1 PEP-CTERM system TPR-repeat protein PrsT [Alteromonas sediminis]